MTHSNFFALIAQNFPRNHDTNCLANQHGKSLLTYAELDLQSAKLAGLLAKLGLQRGDRVLAQVKKSPQALLLYLACLRRGVVFVPLNTAYTPAEVEVFIEDAEPALFVCRPEDEAVARASAKALTLAADGTGSLIDRAAQARPETDVANVAADDVAAILYTSGTTGRSKGAMLTHGNLASNAQALTEAWGWQRDDVLLHALPIYHAHGLFVGVNLSLFNGSQMIFLPKFSVDDVRKNLAAASVFMGVPTFYTRLLADPSLDRAACENMRLFIAGSAPLLAETFSEFESRTGHRILERYGMTEALMITSNPLAGDRIGGTAGYPLPGVSVRVTDDNDVPAPPDDVGQLEITGPNVFKGYWRQPDKTAAEFTPDGWFRTGDLAWMSKDGRVTLVGRSKDLIISGGLNVYPKEIENAIDEHDSVAESAVIGVPHPDFGEAVVAVVVPVEAGRFDKDILITALRSRLAGFKQPKAYITADELPRNAMGKVQKNLLRENAKDYFTA